MSTTAAQDEAFPDLASHDDLSTGSDDTHDLIRSMIAAEAEAPKEAESQSDLAPVDDEATQENDDEEDLDLIRSMIAGDDADELEEPEPDPDGNLYDLSTEDDTLDDQDFSAPEENVPSSFPSFLKRDRPDHVIVDEAHEDTVEDETDTTTAEVEEKVSWAVRRKQKAEAKAAAKAARIAEKQAKIDAKAEAKAAHAAAKQAKIDAAAEVKATKAAAKQAKLDAAAETKAARAAAIQAKADAKTEAKAAQIARKQAKADAAAEAKAARKAAKLAKAEAKAEAKAAKVAARQVKKESKAATVSEKQTEEIKKNVLEAVSLGETGVAAKTEPAAAESVASKAVAAPVVDRRVKSVRSPRKPLRQRAAEFKSKAAGVYSRLPERPTRKQFLRATAVFVLLVEPWLVPIVSLVAVVSLTFAYFAMGPDRAAEITGAGYRWLQKREPERAEKVRAAAESMSEKMSGWISRMPERWSRGVHVPDFSKDKGRNEEVIEDRFDRLAREARSN